MSCVANRFKAVKSLSRLILAGALALLAQLPAMAAQNVMLSWNPSSVPGVAGYKIYSGPTSGNYTSVVDAGNATSVTISGLDDGSTNYFSATTYDASANESAHSDEVTFVAPQATNQVTTTVPIDPTPTNTPAPPQTPGLHVVSGLSFTTNADDIHSVTLAWNPATDAGVMGYQIYIGHASGNYILSWNIAPASSLVITGLVSGTTNFFAVREFDSAWNMSDMSAEVQWLVPFPPVVIPTNPVVVSAPTNPPVTNPVVVVAPPTNPPATNAPSTPLQTVQPVLTAVTGVTLTTNATDIHSVLLKWTASTNTAVTGYVVVSGRTSGHYSVTQDVGLVSSSIATGLVAGTTNFFAVREYDAESDLGALSTEIRRVVPVPPVMHAVTSLTITTNSTDIHTVTLKWKASTDKGIAGYQVLVGQASGNYSLTRSVGMTTSLVISGLVSGTTNFFTVREYDGAATPGTSSAETRWLAPFPAPPNVAPTLNALANLTLNINVGQVTVNLGNITSGSATEHQTLRVAAISSNTGLIPNPSTSYSSPRTTGTITLRPVHGKTGTAVITVGVNDGGNTNSQVTRTFTVTIINQALPTFAQQVAGTRVLKNKPVVLGVTMAGQAPFKYQWKFNGTNLVGQTAATLTLPAVTVANAGGYMVQVSNSAGITNSAMAVVTVITNTIPTISAPAAPQAGQFSFQVPGEAGLKYVIEATTDFQQWTPVQTNTAPFTFTDTNVAGYAQRYYRATYLP